MCAFHPRDSLALSSDRQCEMYINLIMKSLSFIYFFVLLFSLFAVVFQPFLINTFLGKAHTHTHFHCHSLTLAKSAARYLADFSFFLLKDRKKS